MFILTFWIDGVPQPAVARFNDSERALAVLKTFREAMAGTSVDVADDYASRFTLPRSRTLLPIYTDVARDIEAQLEIQVAQQRAQASLQTRLSADPVLGLHRPGLLRAQ
jgi:hypothetical protein